MKKMFTLLLAIGTISSVFAQSGYSRGRQEAREVVVGRTNNSDRDNYDYRNDSYTYNNREKDRQIQQINNDFNQQIQAVRRNRSLRTYEKERQIRMLEARRDQKIREANDRFSNRRNTAYGKEYNKKW